MPIHAVLSDIHANLPALQAVLKDIEARAPQADLWVLGDTVMYGPNPVQCLETLQQRGLGYFLMGNNDHDVLETDKKPDLSLDSREDDAFRQLKLVTNQAALTWTQTQIAGNAAMLKFLNTAQRSVVRPGGRWGVLLVHASPCMPLGLTGGYINEVGDAEEALWCMKENGDKLCFMGHTHMPVCFEEITPQRDYDNCRRLPNEAFGEDKTIQVGAARLLINPGSVGQPRNGDNRAHYLLWDDDTGTVTFRRVPYDIESVVAQLKQSGIPTQEAVNKQPVDMLIDRIRKAE